MIFDKNFILLVKIENDQNFQKKERSSLIGGDQNGLKFNYK